MNTRSIALIGFAFSIFLFVGCGDAADESSMPAEGESATETMVGEDTGSAAAAAEGRKINLNTASGEEFRTIPNVGDRMVDEFEEYRPYVSIQQFRREIGKYVDEEQVAAYEEYVFVPVSPNESDEETLMQLPGVDADVAGQLVAGRPYDSPDAFLEALGEHVSADQVEEAEMYLASR